VQSNVENDRRRADQLLLDAQQHFAANAAVEKLPAAQRSVASDLEQRMAAINQAREQYNQAISATAVDEDETTKALRQQVAAIQTQIDARKKELADAAAARNLSPQQQQQRADLIPTKEQELADLQKTEADARLAYTNREKDLRDAQAAAKSARDSLDRLTELQARQDTLDQKLAQLNRDLPRLDDAAKRAVMPEPVTDADVLVTEDADKRPILLAGSTLGVFAIFAVLMLVALHNTSSGMPMPTMMSSAGGGEGGSASINEIGDSHTPRTSALTRTGTNGDGMSGNGQHDADEDSEPQPA
jgi:hypothetical protein